MRDKFLSKKLQKYLRERNFVRNFATANGKG